MAVVALYLLLTPAFALSRDRALAQYVHSAWGSEEGYAGGAVYAIAQSQDGYLWLGTERGLLRFDGFEFTLVEPPLPGHVAEGPVRSLIEDADGDLWIRLDGPRLLRYHNGMFEDVFSKLHESEAFFTAMTRNDQGKMLLWGPQDRARRFDRGHFQSVSPRDQIDGIVISMLETSSGTIWFGTRDAGLYKIEKETFTQVLHATRLRSINALAPSERDGVWIGSESGLHLWEHGALVDLKLPEGLRRAQVYVLVRDHHHNLWAGTDNGLYRIDPKQHIVTGVLRNQDENTISSVFEDAEGSVWFAGSRRIERLRDGMFTSFSSKETSLPEVNGPIFADDAGRTWFAPVSGGLSYIEDGVTRRLQVPELEKDVIYSISGTKDELWLGRQQGGLSELVKHGDRWQIHTFTDRDGLAQNSVYTVTRAHDGSVWAGTVSGGLSLLRHGRFQTYSVSNGLPSNAIFSSLEGADGKMWFASPGGLILFDGKRWTTYTATNSDFVLNVRTVFEDSGHSLWIGTSHGIALFGHGRIEVAASLPRILKEEVLSIGQDEHGFLWIATADHVLRVDRTKLINQTVTDADVISYGLDDGLNETRGVRRDRSLFSDSSGRIWLSLMHSIAFAGPRDVERYHQPVAVRVEAILAEGKSSPAVADLKLPSDTRSVTFRYAGKSLVMPQRVQFRYRLDGLDRSWSAGASSRQVVYTHLAPGHYLFRIMASNALGLWNGPESDIRFSVQPAFWQTWYFRLVSILLAAMVAFALYRMRLIQVTGQLDRRFQDRLAERTRIAQELHDTLLQGVISASMQLDVAQDHLPEDSLAKPMLRRVLELMRQVTHEGRLALRGLRNIDSSASLESTFQAMLKEASGPREFACTVHVRGVSQPLKTVVFGEVYRIGREAYMNAATHAEAATIEVTVTYEPKTFLVLVRDDGRGIDPQTLIHGREGHWGLSGMRERAQAIGASLRIVTHPHTGTGVELRVPSTIAYAAAGPLRGGRFWRLWKRGSDAAAEVEGPR